ncbi:hypothetical protein [Pelagibacterium mangrovi]|uniref:hypothetical protein n=1 Tax=Pelagibacterium mangrovi TaxID=3119828 RepID=UPI002FCA3C89
MANKNSLTPWDLAAREDDEAGYYCRARHVVFLKAAGWRDLCGNLSSAHMQAALKEAEAFRYTTARPPHGKPEKFYIIDAAAQGDGSSEGNNSNNPG